MLALKGIVTKQCPLKQSQTQKNHVLVPCDPGVHRNKAPWAFSYPSSATGCSLFQGNTMPGFQSAIKD